MDSSLVTIELFCAGLLLASAGLRTRAPGFAQWLADAPIVALAAWAGEDSSIRLYDFYDYAPGWHLWLDRVPLLIPIIWVFVVLSGRDVARVLGGWLPATVFAVVLFDAALIEPCSTWAGQWRWHEKGAFSVPYIGVLGWSCFAASAAFWLDRLRGAARWLTVVLAPLSMHALLLALWWGAFRWVGRGEAVPTVAAACAWVAALAVMVTLWRARRWSSLPFALVLPRLGPASFFLAILLLRPPAAELWVWAAAFVPPWLVATRWSPLPRTSPRQVFL